MIWAGRESGPTADGPAHLVAGLHAWRTGAFDLYPVNPPLVNLLAAAPAAAAGGDRFAWPAVDRRPGARPAWELGRAWFAANGRRGWRLFLRARLALVPLAVAGGAVCFLWARELYGTAGGLIACGLWAFNPTLLAAGAWVGPDAASASAGVAAGYAFWRCLRDRRFGPAVVAGLALGAANLTKLTWVLLFGVWPAIWLLWRLADRREAAGPPEPWRREAGRLAVVLAVGWAALNAGYLFQGTFTPLGGFRFVSESLAGPRTARLAPTNAAGAVDGAGNRFAGTVLGRVPVPLPGAWVRGADVQRRDFRGAYAGFAFGEIVRGTPPLYYLRAFFVKEPVGLTAALFLGLLAVAARPPWDGRSLLCVLVPAAAVLCAVSVQGTLAGHPRYLLPAYGFLFVFAGRAARLWSADGLFAFGPAARRAWAAAAAAAVVAAAGETAAVLPHPHAFFNAAAGGPPRGHRLLDGSAVDWGETLLPLARWRTAATARELDGLTGGRTVPRGLFGLPEAGVPAEPCPGTWSLTAAALADPRFRKWLPLEPVAVVGGNRRVYRIPAAELRD